MVMKTKQFPTRGSELGPFADHYVDTLKAHPGDYQTGDNRTDRLKTLTNDYNVKFAAQLAAQDAAKAATVAKDEAQAALLAELSSVTRLIKGNDEVSNTSLERLGLQPRSTHRTPVQRPTEFPLLEVTDSACLQQTLAIINPESRTRRGKPAGVIGCEIYVSVASTAPSREADYRLVAVATRGSEVVTFADKDGGQPAHYRARWINSRGETGPFSPVFSATIPAI